ncbi:MAG: hypothetical protein JXR97_03775 [Planctomycetes bacterium]|nr:hypothetical protein [Planctomycetota bacterium]
MFKLRNMLSMLCVGAFALCGILHAEEGGDEAKQERGGKFRERMEGKKGERGERGQRGERGGMGQMQEKMIGDLPGGKEEIERHKAAVEAIQAKAKAIAPKVREAMQAAKPDERKTVMEGFKEQFKAIASEMFDENMTHAQKVIDLKKANKDDQVEKILKRMMTMGTGEKMRKHEGGEGGEGFRGRDRGPREGNTDNGEKKEGDVGATPPAEPTEGDIADALAKALE